MTEDKGFAIITVILLMLILSILSMTMISLLRTETTSVLTSERSDDALYLADGGIEWAVNHLRDDKSYSGVGETSLGAGTFIVSVSTISSNRYKLISKGYLPNSTNCQAKREIKAVIDRFVGIPPIFGHAIAAKSTVTLIGNTSVDSLPSSGEGDIYSDIAVDLQGSTLVKGDVYTPGTITKTMGVTVTGTENSGCAPLTFPSIDASEYIDEAKDGGTFVGDLTFGGGGSSNIGPLYINGNLIVQDNHKLHLDGCVYVTGNITVSGNAYIYGNESLVAGGSITFKGTTDLSEIPLVMSTGGDVTLVGNAIACFVYAPNNRIIVSGNPTIYGGIIGSDVKVLGNAIIYHKFDTSYMFPGETTRIEIVSWQEIYN